MQGQARTLLLSALAIGAGSLLTAVGASLPLATYEARQCGIMSACDGPWLPGSDQMEPDVAAMVAVAALAVALLAILVPKWWAQVVAGVAFLVGAPMLLYFHAMASFHLFQERRSQSISGGSLLMWAGLLLVFVGLVVRIRTMWRQRKPALAPTPPPSTP